MGWVKKCAAVAAAIIGLALGPINPAYSATSKGPMPKPLGDEKTQFVILCSEDDPITVVRMVGYTLPGHEDEPIFDYFEAYLIRILQDYSIEEDKRPFMLLATDAKNLFFAQWIDINSDGWLDASGPLGIPLWDEQGEVYVEGVSDQPLIGDVVCDAARVAVKLRQRLEGR